MQRCEWKSQINGLQVENPDSADIWHKVAAEANCICVTHLRLYNTDERDDQASLSSITTLFFKAKHFSSMEKGTEVMFPLIFLFLFHTVTLWLLSLEKFEQNQEVSQALVSERRELGSRHGSVEIPFPLT